MIQIAKASFLPRCVSCEYPVASNICITLVGNHRDLGSLALAEGSETPRQSQAVRSFSKG